MRTGKLIGIGVLLALAVSTVPHTSQASPADVRIAKGTFIWKSRSGTHNLVATLTPTGDNAWSVVWDFKWKDKPQQYTGTIKGDLMNGQVEGTGQPKNGRRKFGFKGTSKDGVLNFMHFEFKGKLTKSTGSGRLVFK